MSVVNWDLGTPSKLEIDRQTSFRATAFRNSSLLLPRQHLLLYSYPIATSH
jgi:hypothetical protein